MLQLLIKGEKSKWLTIGNMKQNKLDCFDEKANKRGYIFTVFELLWQLFSNYNLSLIKVASVITIHIIWSLITSRVWGTIIIVVIIVRILVDIFDVFDGCWWWQWVSIFVVVDLTFVDVAAIVVVTIRRPEKWKYFLNCEAVNSQYTVVYFD